MIYKSFRDSGTNISMLGMGCMRLPTINEQSDEIDHEKAQAVIDYAHAHGINYYDTAFLYHNGTAERFIGHALSKFPRDSYLLATKMPGWLMKPDIDRARIPEIFYEQLENCRVDYFDFYLCHSISEQSFDNYVNLGIIPFLNEMKAQGKIRQLGFSSHGKPETLRRSCALNDWDFAQIQLNYLDWEDQDAKQQYEILEEFGLPVIVMEPLRGGRLAGLSDEADALLKKARPDKSVASWAFRYVQSLPSVQIVLSGMNEIEQLVDNLDTFDKLEPLSEAERTTLDEAVDLLRSKNNIPCTACRYCAGCPQGLDIPGLFTAYNSYAVSESPMDLMELTALPPEKKPSNCIACGNCVSACPQNIDIPEKMSMITELLEKMARAAPPPMPTSIFDLVAGTSRNDGTSE